MKSCDKNILIIDDESLILEGLKKVLDNKGYAVTVSDDEHEALHLCNGTRFDIVFTDLMMPRINGAQICRHIKSLSPLTEVVLISGYPTDTHTHIVEFMDAGGWPEVLRKPFHVKEMISVIEKIIADRDSRPCDPKCQ